MRNKRIISSWSKVKLGNVTHERILNNILNQAHSGETKKTFIQGGLRMKPRFAIIAVAICVCLALGAGITAYAMDVKAYNVSVEYHNSFGIGVDSFSRREVKMAYHDINSGEFTKEITLAMLDEAAQTAGIETDGKNAKELFDDLNTVVQEKQIAKVTGFAYQEWCQKSASNNRCVIIRKGAT